MFERDPLRSRPVRLFLVSILVSILPLIAFTGCASSSLTPPKEHLNRPFIHTIHFSGETLSLIALWYTGKTNNWKEIRRANPKVAAAKLKQGTQIAIPAALLKRRQVLPLSFVTAHPELMPSTQKSVTTATRDQKASSEVPGVENSTGANAPGRAVLTSPSKEIEQRRKVVLEELLN